METLLKLFTKKSINSSFENHSPLLCKHNFWNILVSLCQSLYNSNNHVKSASQWVNLSKQSHNWCGNVQRRNNLEESPAVARWIFPAEWAQFPPHRWTGRVFSRLSSSIHCYTSDRLRGKPTIFFRDHLAQGDTVLAIIIRRRVVFIVNCMLWDSMCTVDCWHVRLHLRAACV
jgi:hypothetical protein